MPLHYVVSHSLAADKLDQVQPVPLGSAIASASEHPRLLAEADIVFCEEGVDPGVLAWVGRSKMVEFVTPSSEQAVSIARACKLANDGWLVVWVTSAAVADQPFGLAPRHGALENLLSALDAAHTNEPHSLATAFNGLAG